MNPTDIYYTFTQILVSQRYMTVLNIQCTCIYNRLNYALTMNFVFEITLYKVGDSGDSSCHVFHHGKQFYFTSKSTVTAASRKRKGRFNATICPPALLKWWHRARHGGRYCTVSAHVPFRLFFRKFLNIAMPISILYLWVKLFWNEVVRYCNYYPCCITDAFS